MSFTRICQERLAFSSKGANQIGKRGAVPVQQDRWFCLDPAAQFALAAFNPSGGTRWHAAQAVVAYVLKVLGKCMLINASATTRWSRAHCALAVMQGAAAQA